MMPGRIPVSYTHLHVGQHGRDVGRAAHQHVIGEKETPDEEKQG